MVDSRLTRREAMKTAVAALTLPLVDECGGEVVQPECRHYFSRAGDELDFAVSQTVVEQMKPHRHPEMEFQPVFLGDGKPYQKTICVTCVKDSTQPNTIEMDWLK